MTVHCWGEDPRGLWTLIVTDNDNNNRKHYLEKLTKGDEEDVTRIFLDNTGKYQKKETPHFTPQKGYPQDHILKTMEDTAGTVFNGDGFAKLAHRKNAHHIISKARVRVSKKNGSVRYHGVKTKEHRAAHMQKHYSKTEKNNKPKTRKVKQIAKDSKRKHIQTNARVVKDQGNKKSSKKYTSSQKVYSETALKRKQKKFKDALKKEISDGKKILKPQEMSANKLNTTSTLVPNLMKNLNTSSASVFKNRNASDNVTALDLIRKLISEIQKNPLVTRIALEALKNPAIGRLFDIESSSENNQKILQLTKGIGQSKNLQNGSTIYGLPFNTFNHTVVGKKEVATISNNTKLVNNRTTLEEPPKRLLRVKTNKHRRIQFFKILKDAQEATHRTDASGSGIGESGNDMDSGSRDDVDQNGSEHLEEFQIVKFQSFRCVRSKNCSNIKKEDTSISGSEKSAMKAMKIPTDFEGEGDSFEADDEDVKESKFGDGDGDDFFHNVKEAVGSDEESEDLVTDFGTDIKDIIREKIRFCGNFSSDSRNNSSISTKENCPENATQANKREREDKTLAHYLAVGKLKSVSEDNEPDSNGNHDESSSLQDLNVDSNSSGDQDSLVSKYNGKDLEVLQEALEDQLSRLSKDPNSQKSNAEILARVKEDINRGDIDDLELLESQITNGKTDLSRVVRSLSSDDEEIDDMDDYADTTPEVFGEFKGEVEELERRRISHQADEQKSSQAYYVEPDKYGKDNSGIIESWTLILYGTK